MNDSDEKAGVVRDAERRNGVLLHLFQRFKC